MRKILLVTAVMIISGCHLNRGPSTTQPPVVGNGQGAEPLVTPPVEDPNINPSQAKVVNWPISLENMVEKVAGSEVITKNDSLLIDNIKNRANIELSTAELTGQLEQIISSTKRFNTVTQPDIDAAKQALGFENEDSLNTRSKTIGLARQLNAPYILYTTIEGSESDLTLSSQIMQVQTGELLWSKSTPVHLD